MRISDWSSDVCSSDLSAEQQPVSFEARARGPQRRRELRRLAAHHEADRHHPEQGRDRDQRDERGEQGDGPAAQAHIAPLRLASRSCTSVTARMHRQSRSEEHTSELQALMRSSYAVFCLKKKTNTTKD